MNPVCGRLGLISGYLAGCLRRRMPRDMPYRVGENVTFCGGKSWDVITLIGRRQ